MATITEIRTAIAAALGAIDDLYVHDTVPDTVTAPAAVVFGPEIDYDVAVSSDDYRFWVVLLVSPTATREAQFLLDSYLSPTGEWSVKVALEVDVTLGGLVDSLDAREVREYGLQEVGDLRFFGAQVLTKVHATR
jgi:hypothetical protein